MQLSDLLLDHAHRGGLALPPLGLVRADDKSVFGQRVGPRGRVSSFESLEETAPEFPHGYRTVHPVIMHPSTRGLGCQSPLLALTTPVS